ncbi:MAG: vWA domain-containing protein [Ilumatobacteraceae bacterium]
MSQTVVSPAEDMAVAFARILRGGGLNVPLDSVLTFVQALDAVGMTNRDNVYWAAQTTLVRRSEDRAMFDNAFAVFWENRTGSSGYENSEPMPVTLLVDDANTNDEDGDADEHDNEPSITLRFSAVETLRNKDFAEYTDDELRDSQRLMYRLRLAGPPRRSMRFHTSRRRGNQHDLRRTVRASLANEGEPILRYWRKPDERLRRLVVLLDISGSMEPYARALLRFMHAAVVGRQRVEAFAFGTRLTRVTKELANRDPDKALARASAQVPDWSGGTRLGESLKRFNDTWGVRGMARGAIVVVLSDGWDRGDPEVLAEQMQRLKRIAYRVVWVNPLKVTPGYAPLARGMAAALPYVDNFVEGHSFGALEHLTDVIAGNQLVSTHTNWRHHA